MLHRYCPHRSFVVSTFAQSLLQAVMYQPFLKSLAKVTSEVFEKMTGTEVLASSVQEDRRHDAHYAAAFTIGYRHLNKGVSGNFTLGFTEEEMAIAVASTIAETMGVEPPKQLDEYAVDLLGEFMNTVFGRVVSEWDGMGFSARFSAPESALNVNLRAPNEFDAEAYVVILKLKVHHILFRVAFVRDIKEDLRGKRVLVVDDSMVIRQLVSKHLKAAQFEVIQARDGAEAIELHRQHRPDLTIIDQVMPKVNGLDAIVEIRQFHPESRFIMLTSTSRRDEMVTAATLNVVNYLIKPLQVVDLMKAVAKAFS
ncbi:MAG TPA: response regulator [Vicinamibacterales bacterium]|nr:response regulator [Vicinamibacterales bacterium]